MSQSAKVVKLKYVPANFYMGSTETPPENPEEVIHIGCFISNPESAPDDGYVNEWMCFTDEQAILKYANGIRDHGGRIDIEYSFIIKPGKTYQERTPLCNFLEARGIDIDNW